MSPLARRLAFLGLVLCAGPAFAQPADVPAEAGYYRSRSFSLPFLLERNKKAQVQQVKLYVKLEPSSQWELHASGSPDQTRYDASTGSEVGSFDVRLDRDGVYSFAVMTVQKDGNSVPPTVADL